MTKKHYSITNLESLKSDLAEACRRADRNIDDVNLIAVSKTLSSEDIIPILEYGHRQFGENRVQECRDKWVELKSKYNDIKLHLIGPLQTNKVKYLPDLVDVIQTVDRMDLAVEIKKHMDKNDNWKPECYIQINTGAEEQKSGILEEFSDKFISECRELEINVVGLMCIPPVADNPALHFALLRKIANRNKINKLSMGMSSDFKIAVEFNASDVRVGSAIFGKR